MHSAFTGKDAVLSFVIYATLDKDYLTSEITLPVKPIKESRLIELLTKVLENASDSIMNITDEEGNICKDFLTLMGELFTLSADYLLALDNIEKIRVCWKNSEKYICRRNGLILKDWEIICGCIALRD